MVKILYYNNQLSAEETDVNGFNCQHYAAHFGHQHILDFF